MAMLDQPSDRVQAGPAPPDATANRAGVQYTLPRWDKTRSIGWLATLSKGAKGGLND